MPKYGAIKLTELYHYQNRPEIVPIFGETLQPKRKSKNKMLTKNL
jgi:hypothetical protein